MLEQGTNRTWKISCVSMQGYTDAERQYEQTQYVVPPEPASATTKTREFQQGDTVTFEDRDGQGITGLVARINQPVSGSRGGSIVNLAQYAAPGDSIMLRFEMGQNCGGGAFGW